MMAENAHQRRRLIAVAAATCISLACGTNYAYSAWAPQFAQKLQLSSTQANVIGTMGNMGMYATGIPVGLFVDSRGPKGSILFGGLCLGLGYFPLKVAYDAGAGKTSILVLCFLSFLTGAGSCAAFSASVKAAALNWPHHRGTATGLPLSAFGLSALFFTGLAGLIYPDDPSGFLLVLCIGTVVLVFGSWPFLWVPETTTYIPVSSGGTVTPGRSRKNSKVLHRHKPGYPSLHDEPSKLPSPHSSSDVEDGEEASSRSPNMDQHASPDSSLLSAPGDLDDEEDESDTNRDRSHYLDISGRVLLKYIEFYQLFFLLGSLTGVGLMTINNIGSNAQALWAHYDPSVTPEFIAKRQLIHVSIISCASFVGRLLSGIGSDVLVKRMNLSRFWCITASASVFLIAQILGVLIENPHFLFVLSGLTGLAYGALFGVYPAIVADAFGVNGLSLNWGYMILSPVVFGNIFNIAYGSIYDSHSVVTPDVGRVCSEGLNCYRSAYWLTFIGAVTGLVLSLWCIHHEHMVNRMLQAREANEDHHA